MNRIFEIAWLIPVLPLLGFIINGLARNVISKSASAIIANVVVLISFILSVCTFVAVKNGNPFETNYFNAVATNWLTIGIGFSIDQLTSLFLLIITGIGFLIHLYSTKYMDEENSANYARYFAYMNLFIFFMLLLVLGNGFLVMFIGWEGVGLCSYLLIGYWFKNINYTKAAKKAFVMNRIGDLGFVLAMFWLISKVGSLHFSDVFADAALAKLSYVDVTAITALLFVGAIGKSAQIPLFTWLPDAMAGPTPVSALIHAATMVTAGIYLIARANILFTMAPATLQVITMVSTVTAIIAATIAIKQNDIKKVLAYSTVSQLGYMFIALGLANYTAGVFHVLTHAFFKALLFLAAGSVIHSLHHQQDMRFMGGLSKKMPITNATMLIGCLAIAGIPPLSGFFSKDEILASMYSRSPYFWAVGVAGALVTAYYMFRLYAMTFLGKYRGKHEETIHENTWQITLPLIVLALFGIIAGFINIPPLFTQHEGWLQNFLSPVFAKSNALLHTQHTLDHSTEWLLMGVSVALVILVIIWSVKQYKNYTLANDHAPKGLGNLFANQWYFDLAYKKVITKPTKKLSKFLYEVVDKKIIDGFVNGIGKSVVSASGQMRKLQSGQIGAYILLMVIAVLIIFIIEFIIKK